MAITREQKEAQVSQIKDELTRSKLTVLANYKGLTVAEAQELRGLLKEQASSMKVAKNSLVKLAASQTEYLKQVDQSVFNGSVALIFGYEDEITPAQVAANFSKSHQALEILHAIDREGNVLEAEQVKHLASLPSKDQLRGQLVGTIAGPLSGLVNVMSGNLRALVQLLSSYQESKSKA